MIVRPVRRRRTMASELFRTTLWSRIDSAREGNPSAVEDFVVRYRSALLRFVRARGFSTEDAEDIVQEVFLRLFTREVLARADKERGRFRAFLAGITRNVIREEWRRRGADKRGAGARQVPLSEAQEVSVEQPADDEFDKIWAEQLLARAMEALAGENPRQHRTLLLRFQQGKTTAEIASLLDRTPQQVSNDLHRARKRVALLVRVEISRYASTPEEYEDELKLFFTLIGLR